MCLNLIGHDNAFINFIIELLTVSLFNYIFSIPGLFYSSNNIYKNSFNKIRLPSICFSYFRLNSNLSHDCLINNEESKLINNNNLNTTIERKVTKLTEILRINKEFIGDVSFIERDLINIFKLLSPSIFKTIILLKKNN